MLKLFATSAAALAICAAPLSHAGECYSEGVRVGVVQKFSQKGFVNKSWEGELVMDGTKIRTTVDGGVKGGDIWEFSVLDPAVAKVINNAIMSGKPVALRYCQVVWSGLKTDTDYCITQAVERQ